MLFQTFIVLITDESHANLTVSLTFKVTMCDA